MSGFLTFKAEGRLMASDDSVVVACIEGLLRGADGPGAGLLEAGARASKSSGWVELTRSPVLE